MEETRCKVIGIARKLPYSALRYVDAVKETDLESAKAAFTIPNLKAVPKILGDEEAVSLMQRMHNFYKTQLFQLKIFLRLSGTVMKPIHRGLKSILVKIVRGTYALMRKSTTYVALN